MSRRYLLVGKLSHENFGDVLMAAIYAKWVLAAGGRPVFYKADPCVARRLSSEVECDFISSLDGADSFSGAIFFGGGYFGHSYTNALSWPRKWISERYFSSVADWLKECRVPYLVSSVEVGPLFGPTIRQEIARILSGADLVSPRNCESFLTAKKLAPSVKLLPGTDVIYEELVGHSNPAVNAELNLGVHATDKFQMSGRRPSKYAAAVLHAVLRNKARLQRVSVIIDSAPVAPELGSAIDWFATALHRSGVDCTIVYYGSSIEMIAALRSVTHFVTTKLHAGVVVKANGGVVLAINDQPKVMRFHKAVKGMVISYLMSSEKRIANRITHLLGQERDEHFPPKSSATAQAAIVGEWLKNAKSTI